MDDVDGVVLELELRGTSGLELTRAILVLHDAVFLFCDIDLQGKRECSDDISSAKQSRCGNPGAVERRKTVGASPPTLPSS
jgi:hypothetical protein